MKRAWILVALALFALVAVAVAPFVGMEDIPVNALWKTAEEGRVDVLWKIRIPRVAIAFLAGAGLATAGMVFQAMFHNPLATPFTLGVSSGASLGAAISIHLGWTFSIVGLPVISWLAFAGAMAAILLVYGLTRTAQGFSTSTMLLAGVAVSFFFSSLILFLQYLSDPTRTFRLLRWTMGGLASVVGFDEVMSVLPFVTSGCLIVLYMTHQLNLITTGEELAAARGVEVNRMKITPFTLGVSSGASLGAAISIHLGWTFSIVGLPVISWLAFAGAMAAILLVYGLTRTAQGFSTSTMLLAGVAVSFFFSSLILFLQYLSDPTRTFRLLRWTMGGLASVVGFDEVMSVLPFVTSGCLIVLYMTHQLNLITTGEELAAARGVEVNRMKITLFFVASAIVGAVVAVCGPIGFVGLMAPHICRLLTGADHRYLAPATVLFGGGFLVLCDTVARTAIAPTELPVGILTALMGGPFFLWLLLARSSRLETLS